MKLSDIFDQLSAGPLSQLSMVEDGEITSEHVNKIIHQVNAGLTDLHRRFFLRQETHELDVVSTQLRYPLKDLGIIEILDVSDKDGHLLLLNPHDIRKPMNEVKPPHRVFTPVYNILRFDPVPDGTYLIRYQARHPIIEKVEDFASFDASLVDVELPLEYLNALVFYIASKVITPIVGQLDGNPQEGVMYTQLYEAECQQLTANGLDVSDSFQESQFHQKGFV